MKTGRMKGVLGAIGILLAGVSASAQWVTETIPLKAGWNAVYLHVDASHVSLNELVGSDAGNPIEEIWMWAPPGPALQFFDTLQSPQTGSTEWLRWDRYWAGASPLQRLAPNVAVLVRVKTTVANYNWELQGKPVPPRYDWTSSGMNLIGFATPRATSPTWGSFLGPSRSLHDYAEIYRYVGGPLSTTNPQRLFSSLLRSVPLVRNHAYWVRSEEYNRYFGPFEVELQQPNGVHFGASRAQYRLRLKNRINQSVTVTAELVSSEAPPAGEQEIDGLVPLILRGEQDMSTLNYDFTRFSEGNGQWTLTAAGQAGSDIEVVVGLDRTAMAGLPGDYFAGILRFRDTTGMVLIDIPVSAEVAGTTGLWVGNAVIGEVAHYLVDYTLGAEGRPELNPDGSFAVENVDESFGPVARPMPLRLVLHNNGTGNARLLQRVYFGANEAEEMILSHLESELAVASLDEARRISVAHLPWTEANRGWEFDGPFSAGADIRVEVVMDYADQMSNPFVHTFHPDHDNLDARFENELPRGVESYDIVREIRLIVQPPGGDFASVTEGTGVLSGEYNDTVTLLGRSTDAGAHSRTFRSRGGFALNLVSEIPTLAGYTEPVVVVPPDDEAPPDEENPIEGPDTGTPDTDPPPP